ncbi:Hypothetical predicted protein, partial [Lecanosticta acicola]
ADQDTNDWLHTSMLNSPDPLHLPQASTEPSLRPQPMKREEQSGSWPQTRMMSQSPDPLHLACPPPVAKTKASKSLYAPSVPLPATFIDQSYLQTKRNDASYRSSPSAICQAAQPDGDSVLRSTETYDPLQFEEELMSSPHSVVTKSFKEAEMSWPGYYNFGNSSENEYDELADDEDSDSDGSDGDGPDWVPDPGLEDSRPPHPKDASVDSVLRRKAESSESKKCVAEPRLDSEYLTAHESQSPAAPGASPRSVSTVSTTSKPKDTRTLYRGFFKQFRKQSPVQMPTANANTARASGTPASVASSLSDTSHAKRLHSPISSSLEPATRKRRRVEGS